MNFRSVPPSEVASLEKAPAKPKRGMRLLRANSLGCYTPPGSAQASRRITGSHLEADSPEMENAAMYFTEGLLNAMGEGNGMVRSLIGPARCSDRILERYCRKLFKSAMGKPSQYLDNPVSPLLVQYLLGGVPWKTVEELTYRALNLLDFMPDPIGANTMGAAFSIVGFGANIRHDHADFRIKHDLDNVPYEADFERVHNHLSFRQDFLLGLPNTGSYASILIRDGAYNDGLRRQLASWKPAIMAEAERLLDPKGGEMSDQTAKGEYTGHPRLPVTPTDYNFKRAVKRVFEQDWDRLDLVCGTPDTALLDAEVLMARLIIQRMGYAPKITAQQLIGMSLLTGISIANWTAFAVKDRQRRGETFITAETIEQVIDQCSYQDGYDCDHELRDALYTLAHDSEHMAAKKKWARRLQSPNNPLWSVNGLYYQVGKTHHGVPICKPKPFRATAAETDDDQ